MRGPSISRSLRKLTELGVPIGSIIDVGVLTCTPHLVNIFPHVQHLLVEPIEEFNDAIESIYRNARINFHIENIAASDFNGRANMRLSSVVPGKPISHARLTKDVSGENLRNVAVRTLDSILETRSLPPPYLLKIDVDGAELDVLRGASQALKNTSVVIIEALPSNFVERLSFIESKSFQIFDIVEICYYDDWLSQVDVVFINKRMAAQSNLKMISGEFDLKKWHAFDGAVVGK
jgi:FkbM family methyltransferase